MRTLNMCNTRKAYDSDGLDEFAVANETRKFHEEPESLNHKAPVRPKILPHRHMHEQAFVNVVEGSSSLFQTPRSGASE